MMFEAEAIKVTETPTSATRFFGPIIQKYVALAIPMIAETTMEYCELMIVVKARRPFIGFRGKPRHKRGQRFMN